jgi:hypothetical protein
MIKVPSAATLRKYGLTDVTWLAILASQGNVCPICNKVPTTGRFVTDHYHVKGFKDLPFEEKAQWVRGVTCWWCNSVFLGRGVTIEKAQAVVDYLKAFKARMEKQ